MTDKLNERTRLSSLCFLDSGLAFCSKSEDGSLGMVERRKKKIQRLADKAEAEQRRLKLGKWV